MRHMRRCGAGFSAGISAKHQWGMVVSRSRQSIGQASDAAARGCKARIVVSRRGADVTTHTAKRRELGNLHNSNFIISLGTVRGRLLLWGFLGVSNGFGFQVPCSDRRRRVQSKPPPVGSDPQDPYSVKSTWAGAYRTCFSLTNRWVCYAQTYGAVMHRGSDHLKPVRFLSFYGFVMRRPALTSRAVSSTMQDPLCVKRAWVRCVTTYASVSATWGWCVTTHVLLSERGFDTSRPTRPLVRRGFCASRPTSC